jgi:dienelactone hydrolase
VSRKSGKRIVGAGLLAIPIIAVALAACAPAPTPVGSYPAIPTAGRFSTPVYAQTDVSVVHDVVYGTAVDVNGATVQLGLDLYVPPATGGARPAVVLVHGGGFTSGTRQNMASTAMSYAVRGFVAATISYRLDPDAQDSVERYLAAATAAVDDGMESVRWIRSNADAFQIDEARIAVVGSSAGGAVALGVALADDPTPTGPLAQVSPTAAAAVSTGATLTPGISTGFVTFQATDAPTLMFHYDVDTVTQFSASYSRITCDEAVRAGARCRFVQLAGSGHTVSVSPAGSYWTSEIGPFLWSELRLDALP